MTATMTETVAPDELGPDSMLWQYAGDRRIYLVVPMTGLLLNMLPGVSAGIEQHSEFFSEPWARTVRSIPQIIETIYDTELAIKVRDYHRPVKGIDHHGRRYSALDPALYFAAHAIFTYTVMTTVDVFGHPLSDAERRRLYDECKLWYRRYGISERNVPADWDEFCVYWDDLCTNGLEATPVARAIVDDLYRNPNSLQLPRLPRPVYRLLRPLVRDQVTLLATGLLPPAARDTLGLDYSTVDRRRFDAQAAAVRTGWHLVPPGLRHTRRSRAGKQRALLMASYSVGSH